MTDVRLLLVEFLSTDRYSQYRSEWFPFIRGYAAQRGVAVDWVAVGYEPEALPGDRFRMSLPPAETAGLGAAVRGFAPTHVILNEHLSAALDDALRAAAGGAALAVAERAEGAPDLTETPALDRWLGLPPRGRDAARHVVDAAAPDWTCSLLGETARRVRPLIQVVGGVTCLYRAPLARNPFYEGLDLSGASNRERCAFCSVSDETRYPYRTPAVDLALAQLRAARRTCPPERWSGEFLLCGVHIPKLRAIFEGVLADGMEPCDFQLACRVDELNRRAVDLDDLLPRLVAAGHRVAVWSMGVENFSETENLRMNKGITVSDIEQATALLDRWERAWPDHFRFWERGGFGFILYTPWTTIADLRTNFAQAERFRIGPQSFFFVSRLQLMPGRPVTLLAERDGLTVADARDADMIGFDSGCVVSVDERERPWRFREPAVAAVYRFALRLQRAGAGMRVEALPDDDPGLVALRGLLDGLPAALRSPYRLLPLALDVVERDGPLPVSALVARLATAPALQAAREPASGKDEDAPARAAEGPAAALRERVRTEVRRLLARMAAHPRQPLAGFAPAAVGARATDDGGWGELSVDLRRGNERLLLHLFPRLPERPAFRTTERFGVGHDETTPLDTEQKRRVVAVVARAVERFVGRTEP